MKKKRIRTFFLWVGSGLIALILTLQALFFFFGDEILKESILVAFDQYATRHFQEGHLPVLDFDELRLNLLGGNISVTDLNYKNGLPRGANLDSVHSFYHIHIPEVTIKGVRLWDIYQNRQVRLDQIYLQSPRVAITLEQSEQDTTTTKRPPSPRALIAQQEQKIYESLSEYIELLAFNRLEVVDATFLLSLDEDNPLAQDSLTYGQSDWFAHKFTITLEDFRLDSVARFQDQRLLFTKNILIKLGNYRLILPDSSYAIRADTLTFSTFEEKLSFQSLEVIPLQAKDSASWYSLTVPKLDLTHVDLLQMYHHRIVSVDSLRILRPQLKGYERSMPLTTTKNTSRPQLSQLHPDTLYSRVEKYWRRIAIDQFQITEGQLALFEIEEDTLPWLEVPDYSLSFNDFLLDSTINQRSVDSLSHVLPMDSIEVALQHLRLWFPDRQHYFSASRFQMRTDRYDRYSCNIQFDSARVLPRVDSLSLFLSDPQRPRLGYHITTSRLNVFGINLEELSFSKSAFMDSVRVVGPQVAVANFSEIPFGSLPRQIDSSPSDTTETTIREIFYNWSHARLNLYPVVAPNRPDAWFEQLLVNSLHLDSGRVQILKANSTLTEFNEIAHVERLQAYYQDLSIGNEAHPLIELSDTTAFAFRVAVFAEEVDMKLTNSWFQFPYNRNSAVSRGWLQAAEVTLSTLTSRGYVRKVKFWPNQAGTRWSSSHMEQLHIPYFGIEGIDFGQLYNLQIADINRVSLLSPTIDLRISPGTKQRQGDFAMSELYEQVEPYLNRLSINHLQVQQADITIRPRSGPTPDSWFSTSSLNINVEDFFLDSATSITPVEPFYAQDVKVTMNHFDFSLPVEDGEEYFQAERFMYSSFSDQLTVDSLQRIRDSLLTVDALQELKVTQLALHRMDYYQYFTDEKIAVEKVIVRRPNVDIRTSPDESEKEQSSRQTLQPLLYPKIKSVAKGIYVDELMVEEGKLLFLKQAEDTLHHFRLDTMFLKATNLAIDSSSHEQEAKMFFADEIDFSIHLNNYILRLPQAQQIIRARVAKITNLDKRIKVDDLDIQPYGFSMDGLTNFPSKNLLSFHTPSLQVVGFDAERAYLKGEMNMEEMNIMNPDIKVYSFAPDSSHQDKKPGWSDVVPGYLNQVGVNQINFTNGRVNVYQHQDHKEPAFGAERIDVSVLGLLIDSVSYEKFMTASPESTANTANNITRRLLLADDLLVRIRDYQLVVADTLYTAKAKLISLSTKNPQLEISEFALEPRVPRYLYKDSFKFQKTRVAAQARSIQMNKIDFEELIKQRHLVANDLIIDSIQIDAFKDARVPRNEDRRLPMHQEMLLNLGFLISLDTVRVSHGFINYAERAPESGRDGIITFENLNGLLLNATNHPDRLRDSVVFRLMVSTQVMGKGELKASFRFPMADKRMRFTANGILGPVDLKEFNPILEPAAFVHIRKGYANGMRFLIQGDQEKASGSMRFNYEDLSIMLVDKDKGRPGLDERVGSLLANAFVVKSNNPRSLFLRIGEIDYERDPSRSVFSYWWRSMLSGIKSSIGMQPVADRTRDVTVLEEEEKP